MRASRCLTGCFHAVSMSSNSVVLRLSCAWQIVWPQNLPNTKASRSMWSTCANGKLSCSIRSSEHRGGPLALAWSKVPTSSSSRHVSKGLACIGRARTSIPCWPCAWRCVMTGGRRCGRKRLPVERPDQPSLRPFPQDNRARSEPLFAPLLHQPPKPPLNRAILPTLFGMRPNPPCAFFHVTARVHSAWKSRTARQRHQYVRSVGCRWCACVATGAGNTVQTPAERGRIEPGAPRLLRVQRCRSGSSGRPSPDCHGSPSRVAVPPMHHMLHS